MNECPKCGGCGEVADTVNEEPWGIWAALPYAVRKVAERTGLLKPKPCPECTVVKNKGV